MCTSWLANWPNKTLVKPAVLPADFLLSAYVKGVSGYLPLNAAQIQSLKFCNDLTYNCPALNGITLALSEVFKCFVCQMRQRNISPFSDFVKMQPRHYQKFDSCLKRLTTSSTFSHGVIRKLIPVCKTIAVRR